MRSYKPKVIISSYDDLNNPYYGGGGSLAVHEVAKRLTKDFHITVISGRYPKSLQKQEIDGVVYHRVGWAWSGPFLGQLLFHFWLIKEIATKGFDLWMESFTPPFSTSFLPLFTKKPVIGLVHMLSGQDMRRKYWLPFDWIENIGLRVYDNFIVTSESFGKKIQKQSPKSQIRIIPNGVNLKELYVSRKKHEYILFLGRIEVNQKGLDLLLKAYASVKTQIKVPLVVAGNGSSQELSKLNHLIQDLGLTKEDVKIIGRIDTMQQKKDLFTKAMFCVVSSRFETFSLVALETLSTRTALVSFDIEGLQWIPKNASIKTLSFDQEDLANNMLALSNDIDLRRKIAYKGADFAKTYDWESITQNYIDTIKMVLKSQSLADKALLTL